MNGPPECFEPRLATELHISNELYHMGPGISKSGLDLIAQSPAHFRWTRDHPTPPTDAERLGTCVHTAILEPHLIDSVMVAGLHDEHGAKLARRSKAAKEAWAEFEAEHAGKLIVSRDEQDMIYRIADAVHDHPTAGNLLAPAAGPVEASFMWPDPITGQLVKCRPDKINTEWNVVVDLKTTMNASHAAFTRDVAKYRYYMSDYITTEGLAHAGRRPEAYCFVCVEKQPPYAVATYYIAEHDRELAAQVFADNMAVYHRCRETDEWPGYPPEVQEVEIPRYVYHQLNSRNDDD